MFVMIDEENKLVKVFLGGKMFYFIHFRGICALKKPDFQMFPKLFKND